MMTSTTSHNWGENPNVGWLFTLMKTFYFGPKNSVKENLLNLGMKW
jgi:hypothetical protein